MFFAFSEVTIFHQGTDGIGVEYAQIETKEGNEYRCSFDPELIDKQRFKISRNCFVVWNFKTESQINVS